LALWARLPVVTDAVSALPLFEIGLNERLVFLAAFGISALAALGAQHFREQSGFPLLLATLATLSVILGLYRELRPTLIRLEMDPDFLQSRLLAQVVPLVLLAALLVIAPFRRWTARVPVFALLLLVAERKLEAGGLYPTFPNRVFYPDLPVLDPIPRTAPWRFTATSFQFIPNVSALYELEDVRGYEAMTFQPLTETFPLWCVPQPIWFNRIDDPTAPFLAFLNVRWLLTPEDSPEPSGWKTLAQGGGTRLLENPSALPRVFVPRLVQAVASEDAQREALGSIQDFAEHGIVGKAGAAWPSGEWKPNGRATVRIESYRVQSVVLVSDAERLSIVGTSIPAWPGWRLGIDERSSPLLSYNRAFLGFEVPAGRHRVTLRYLPNGVVWGAGMSGATAAACVIYALARRKKRMRGGP
ncbi:MAG TPA: YfhO family protein, partial [Thermoanaerobaculia bacterium]|nr:YfhO family protein [Thermoanaerobaculia bacterium]